MSISKSQAALLASGFLGGLGTDDKAGLIPRESLTQLFLLAGEFVESAQDNLNHDNTNATGKLSASLKLNDPVDKGEIISVDVEMDYYGQFINKGVKGTKSGSGKYAFKNPYPNKKMAAALLAGVNRAKKSTTNVSRSRSVSRNEIKNVKISDIDKVYGAATNIKKYGIKATGFIDKAFTTTEAKSSERFGAAFKIDIINSLPAKI